MKDFTTSAMTKTVMPRMCWKVQTLGNRTKDKKRVVAFLAVLVMLMLKAPKCFVIAPAQLLPKNPIRTKTNVESTFSLDVYECDPSRTASSDKINPNPFQSSPVIVVATNISDAASEYRRNISSS
mmetsp:Transcript_16204/g.33253  ORF Transcript_16204/g.33253 Transcript_16204/m.33253 type:complete len:125 (-) Transcript_16204:1197-1571(-)